MTWDEIENIKMIKNTILMNAFKTFQKTTNICIYIRICSNQCIRDNISIINAN